MYCYLKIKILKDTALLCVCVCVCVCVFNIILLPQASYINLQKKNSTNIFPVRTKQASSIKFLLSWLYFEFPDGTAHLIGETRADYYKTPFLQNFCQNFQSDNKKMIST